MDLRFIYLIAIGLSLAETIIFYETTSNKTNKNFFLLYVMTLVSNFGYAMSVHTSTLEAALCGEMISYIGSIFTIMIMLLVVIELCNGKIFNLWRALLVASALILSIIVCTTKETNLFFSQPEISKLYGLTVVRSQSGPVMFFYIGYLAFINIAAVFVVLKAFVSKKHVSRKTLWSLLGMIIFGTLAYLIPLFLGIHINFMPFTYIAMEGIFIIISIRANMYDLSGNLMSVYKSRGGYGYIAFDRKKHFLGCDEFALLLFPELQNVPIDYLIPDSLSDIMEKLHYNDPDWDWDFHIDKDFTIKSNTTTAICTIHSISHRHRNIGYLFELRDNTVQQNYINDINQYNKLLSKAVEEKTQKIVDIQDSIIKGMAMMVESRDNSTGGHILRTSDCVRIFSEELLRHKEFEWCTPYFTSRLVKAAPMHDLGKIAVDDSILRKPGKFEPAEYDKMKKHAVEGSIIVREVLSKTTDTDFIRIAVNVAHYHHEKWDGTGYPEKKKGNEIPIEARIMALADVFDALVSRRCYKDAKSFDEAFDIIKNDLGRHFDPVIGKVFLECRPQLEEYYMSALSEM